MVHRFFRTLLVLVSVAAAPAVQADVLLGPTLCSYMDGGLLGSNIPDYLIATSYNGWNFSGKNPYLAKWLVVRCNAKFEHKGYGQNYESWWSVIVDVHLPKGARKSHPNEYIKAKFRTAAALAISIGNILELLDETILSLNDTYVVLRLFESKGFEHDQTELLAAEAADLWRCYLEFKKHESVIRLQRCAINRFE